MLIVFSWAIFLGGFFMNKNWLMVVIAAAFEIVWVIGLAHAYDFWTWSGTVIGIIISNYLLIKASGVLPAGTVYSVFVGVGTAGTVIIEILFFNEPFKISKILLIAVLLYGVIGLKMVTDEEEKQGGNT